MPITYERFAGLTFVADDEFLFVRLEDTERLLDARVLGLEALVQILARPFVVFLGYRHALEASEVNILSQELCLHSY